MMKQVLYLVAFAFLLVLTACTPDRQVTDTATATPTLSMVETAVSPTQPPATAT